LSLSPARSEKYKKEDEEYQQGVQARNHLDAYCHSMTKTIEDSKISAKISPDDKTKLETAIKETKDWLARNSEVAKEEVEKKQKELENLANPIMTKVLVCLSAF
jgi:L1 cell adhesion molecule like protein